MATLTVRNLDDGLKARLRMRAAENGRSSARPGRGPSRIGETQGALAP